MLKPSNAWGWYFNKKEQVLMLDLGDDIAFKVSIEPKYLIPDAFVETAFSVDDASLFQLYWDAMKPFDFSDPRKMEIVLNAIAVVRFQKPLLPKSWFFLKQNEGFSAHTSAIVQLMNDHNKGLFLVVERSDSASICMSVSENAFNLTESKQLRFCETIKVMNDRLQRWRGNLSGAFNQKNGNFALVG